MSSSRIVLSYSVLTATLTPTGEPPTPPNQSDVSPPAFNTGAQAMTSAPYQPRREMITMPMQTASFQPPSPGDDTDSNLWLEDVNGDVALSWVRQRNAETSTWATGPAFTSMTDELREVLDSKDKIPFVAKHGPYYYNLWKDAEHPRGLWRRTTLDAYRTTNPTWETVLDIDALGQQEGQSWVFQSATFLEPNCERCLLTLSPGGSDASVTREFDVRTKAFVSDGFAVPLAKSQVTWINFDTVLVCTDMGPDSLTTSGYPREVRRWQRGQPLAQAPVIFAGESTDVSVGAYHDATLGFERTFLQRSPTFFTQQTYWIRPNEDIERIDAPEDARRVSVHREWLLIHLRREWLVHGRTFPADTLLAAPFAAFMSGQRDFTVLFEPSVSTTLQDFTWTRDHLILDILDDVKTRMLVLTPTDNGPWERRPLPGVPSIGTAAVAAVDDESNDYFMTVEDFLTPTSLYHGTVGASPEKLKNLPAYFDAAGLQVEQYFATSKDGTRVPYFQIAPSKMQLDGTHRTLLTGYGGFEISLLPVYSGTLGRGWLKQGGVYVVANIRGGGEYGPLWHQAALKEKRLRAYEDFAAVAEDLIHRGVTQPQRLGISGGSNGGLLMGNMVTQYPHLFGAVVCKVPLLDMKRYTHLLAGASWIGEYGDPDKPEQWNYMQAFSPYHNLRDGISYPPVLFTTSTRDDRVHPGHARKMMEKMRQAGCNVHYYENIEGGHGGAADNAQTAYMLALSYTFFHNMLKSSPSG